MPRIRSVKPEFWDDEELQLMPPLTRLAFIHLWNIADDVGRFRAHSRLLQSQLLPYDPEDKAALLAPLVDSGHVVLYQQAGQQYGEIQGFRNHQKPNRPTPTKLPPPPGEPSRPTHGALSEQAVIPHKQLTPGEERRGEERRGIGEERMDGSAAPPRASRPPIDQTGKARTRENSTASPETAGDLYLERLQAMSDPVIVERSDNLLNYLNRFGKQNYKMTGTRRSNLCLMISKHAMTAEGAAEVKAAIQMAATPEWRFDKNGRDWFSPERLFGTLAKAEAVIEQARNWKPPQNTQPILDPSFYPERRT